MIASLGPLPSAAEYLEGVLCPVSKLLCYLFDSCFGDAHVAESARKFEPLDEGSDAFGWVSAEGIGELFPAISRYPVADYFEGGRKGYAGGVAVGDVVARPDPAPQVVREAHGRVQGAEVRHPGPELELVAHLHVLRIILRAWQTGYEPSRSFRAHNVFYRMVTLCQEAFYGVIQGSDTGRKPEL